MWNEHFGIGIVEMMAAGLIVIANNSGGPKSDIVVPFNDEQQRANSGGDGATSAVARLTTTGFLASSVDEYAGFMYRALTLDPKEAAAIRRNARASAKRFTDEVFAESFEKAILELKIA